MTGTAAVVPETLRRGGRLLAAAAGLALALAAGPEISRAAETVRIFAAASTLAPLREAARLYEEKTGTSVAAVFASSGALARQIAAGAPADLYLSADRAWMDWAEGRGLLATGSRRVLLTNRLVLAAAHDSRLEIALRPGADLAGALGDGKLAIADPQHAPLGAYARAALKWLGAWEQVAPRAIRFADAAQARVQAERGEAAAAILYASDVAGNPRLRRVATFPPSAHPPIEYELARIAGRPAAPVRRFAAWLSGPSAAPVFARHGFGVD